MLHVDFTSIEETVPLKEEPVIRNVLVLQDHFSKYVVAYVVKDQTARTAAVTLRNGYFGLFGYLVSDQGKAFTGHLITHLCELYGVHKLRTSPYHAQTNGQVADLGISRRYVRGQAEKAGPYLLDLWIVLAIQLIPCRNENGLCCFGRQVLLLLGCSLTPVCWFLRAQGGLGRLGIARPALPRMCWSCSWGCEIQSLDLQVGVLAA